MKKARKARKREEMSFHDINRYAAASSTPRDGRLPSPPQSPVSAGRASSSKFSHAQAATTYLPKPILLPDTFGSQPGQDFVNYMSHFDNACAPSGYTHEQCLRLLPARLVGVPHEMLTDIVTNSPNITYREAVEALRARLEPPQLALMHEATLRQRVKLATETQYAFAQELRRLARQAYPG